MPTLTPAYGRDYKSGKAAIQDYKDGKDFILNDVTSQWHGRYCSIRDKIPGDIFIRFNKLQNVVVVPNEENS